jgi:hypothetical protein
VSHRELLEAERFLKSLPRERGLVVHPLLERMSEIDNADVDKRILY